MLPRLIREERGSTAMEYALIGVLVGVVFIAAAALIGERLRNFFQTLANLLP